MNLSMTKMQQLFLLLIIATQLTGCTESILFGSNHKSNCLGATLPKITNPAKVTGQAEYEKRIIPKTTNAGGLGEIDDNTYPIRFAEVEVLSGNDTIYCTSTDGSGNFTIEVPTNRSNLTVKVNSISPKNSNKTGHIFVQNNPIEDEHYTLSSTVSSSNTTPIQLMAHADRLGIKGGAFNILDKIVQTNLFLNEMTQNCGDDCKPFDSAPPAYLYWEAGVNPLADIICKYKICKEQDKKKELSFFDRDTSQMFILGGTNGDINGSDTDHFDDSVIVHEYFHFILTHAVNLYSPGGDHDSTAILDPRLAFSEGMANALAVLTLGDPLYIDTVGIGDKGAIKVSLNSDNHTWKTGIAGEGNFVELLITKTIWDMMDPFVHNGETIGSDDDESVTMKFSEFWEVLTGEFASDQYHFKDFGLFTSMFTNRPDTTNIDEILEQNLQKSNREDYASTYDPCDNYELVTPPSPGNLIYGDNGVTNNYIISDQFLSNDFHMYEHAGGSFTAEVTYDNDGAETNLDVYVYREFYKFGSMDDLVGFSNRDNDNGLENIQISDLPSGIYMINISSVRPLTVTTYNLSLNGEICPNS